MQVVSVCYSPHYQDKENSALYEDYGWYFKLTYSEDMNSQEASISADVSDTVHDYAPFPNRNMQITSCV